MRLQVLTGQLLMGFTALVALGSGCNHATTTNPGQSTPPPITTPTNTWSWVDVPSSTCDEGTPTGLGANLADSKNLVLFFNGGGACWDYGTCVQAPVYTPGPFTAAQFTQLTAYLPPGSIFDRQAASNPFKDWNMFFFPYCTGDLHAGNADTVYTSPDGASTKTIHHRGRANTEAFLARIAATFPNPERVLVTGSSAGGYGSLINYDLVRSTFPNAQITLVDDSGPPLKNSAISASLREAWSKAWNYQPVLNALDPALNNDFSGLFTALARKYPNDRLALLSSLQDQTIRAYLLLTPTAFQAALEDLDSTVIAPLPHARSFVTSGQNHTMLLNPGSQSSQGVHLYDWLQQMQGADDATWKSLHP